MDELGLAIILTLSINMSYGPIIEVIIIPIIAAIVVLYVIKNKKNSNNLNYEKVL